jgi:hypothetical protein
MTEHNLNFRGFAYSEIEQTIQLLRSYLNEKYNGDTKIWIRNITFDDNSGDVLLTATNREKYTSTGTDKLIKIEDE